MATTTKPIAKLRFAIRYFDSEHNRWEPLMGKISKVYFSDENKARAYLHNVIDNIPTATGVQIVPERYFVSE